jgi:protein-disulfide isomerase
VEALIGQEVEAKVSEPTAEEIQQLYDSNKERLGDATLDQVRERIVVFLRTQKQGETRQTFLESLKGKHRTTVALRPPVVEVGDGGRPAKGPANAPVTIIEFSDYECPYCKRAEETIQQVLRTYGDKVRLVYRDYPLPFHANARPASEAAACAEDQGKFWEYHEKLWAAPDLGEATLKKIAGEVGLEQAKFDKCLSSKQFAAKVDQDVQDASKVGVNGTPAFFINGRMISGAQPFEKFKEIIDEELAARGTKS